MGRLNMLQLHLFQRRVEQGAVYRGQLTGHHDLCSQLFGEESSDRRLFTLCVGKVEYGQALFFCLGGSFRHIFRQLFETVFVTGRP